MLIDFLGCVPGLLSRWRDVKDVIDALCECLERVLDVVKCLVAEATAALSCLTLGKSRADDLLKLVMLTPKRDDVAQASEDRPIHDLLDLVLHRAHVLAALHHSVAAHAASVKLADGFLELLYGLLPLFLKLADLIVELLQLGEWNLHDRSLRDHFLELIVEVSSDTLSQVNSPLWRVIALIRVMVHGPYAHEHIKDLLNDVTHLLERGRI